MKEDFQVEMRCIGMRISGFRKLRNMTQAELADIDGVYKSDLKSFWRDMKETFDEMKKLNDDMDKMLEQFDKADKIFSENKNS